MSTRQKIVVVEDDPSVVRSLHRLLRAAGFHVLTFSSAEKLLQSGIADTASCFVFDIHLPGLSGIELQRRLCAIGDFHHRPRRTGHARGGRGFRRCGLSAQALSRELPP
jgi:FixJ family two-component response regulator